MRYKNNCFFLVLVSLKSIKALLLKVTVPYREDFVHQENVAVGVDGDGEGEADLHAAGVVFELLIYETFQLGEAHNVVEFLVNLLAREPEYRRVQVHIVPPGELRIEANPQFQKRRDPPIDRDASAVGAVNPGEDFQECTLTRAVAPDDAKKLSLFNAKTYFIQRLEFFVRTVALEGTHKRPAQATDLLMRDAKHLGNIMHVNCIL